MSEKRKISQHILNQLMLKDSFDKEMQNLMDSVHAIDLRLMVEVSQRLAVIFKKVGAVRCYYICLMIYELVLTLPVENATEQHLQAVLDQYPNLIEFLCEFLLFQDYISQNKDDHFISILKTLPLSTRIKMYVVNGEIVVVYEGKHNLRLQRVQLSLIIPKAIQA